jgi:uncharacterized membrane protein HdeD (DUF308 family)
MKKTGTKLLYIVIGILLLIVGGYLIILEFRQHDGSGHYRKWHKYPFLIFGAGIVMTIAAFIKDDQVST